MTLVVPPARVFAVRPVQRADAPALQDFVCTLDPTSRRLRFHGALNGCTPALLRHLTEVDGQRHVAFVAWVPSPYGAGTPAIVGEARYFISAEGDAAEFAICVGAAHRGSGIADALMRQLLEAAQAARIGWIYGDVLADNVRMAGFLHRHGFARTLHPHGETGVERWERAVGERPQRRAHGIRPWLGRWLSRDALAAAGLLSV